MKKNTTRMSNVEFVEHLMTYKSPMAQLVILTAIDNYTKHVIMNREQVLKEMENSFIHGEAWCDACMDIQKALEGRDEA